MLVSYFFHSYLFISDPLRDVEKSLSPRVLGTHLPWDLAPTPVREGKVKVTTLIYTNYSSNIYILNLGNKMAREGGRFLSLSHSLYGSGKYSFNVTATLVVNITDTVLLLQTIHCIRNPKDVASSAHPFLTKTGVISGLTWDRFICNYMAGNGKY